MDRNFAVIIVSTFSLIFCLVINLIHAKSQSRFQSSTMTKLSHIQMFTMSIPPLFLVLSYAMPMSSNGTCYCGFFINAAIIFYVLGLYALKYMYMHCIIILTKDAKLAQMSKGNNLPVYIYIILSLFAASCVASIVMTPFLVNAQCNDNNVCSFDFHPAEGYLSLFVLLADVICFSLFCMKCYDVFDKARMDNEMYTGMMKKFLLTFFGTAVMMISAFCNVLINLIAVSYWALLFVSLDCSINIFCNFLMYGSANDSASNTHTANMTKDSESTTNIAPNVKYVSVHNNEN